MMETLPEEILQTIVVSNITIKNFVERGCDPEIYKITNKEKILSPDELDLYRIIVKRMLWRTTCKQWNKIWLKRVLEIKTDSTIANRGCDFYYVGNVGSNYYFKRSNSSRCTSELTINLKPTESEANEHVKQKE